MNDVGFTLLMMAGTAFFFYTLGRADGLSSGRAKTNVLVRDTARTLQNALDMLTSPSVRPPEIRQYLARNIRRLQDGEKLE